MFIRVQMIICCADTATRAYMTIVILMLIDGKSMRDLTALMLIDDMFVRHLTALMLIDDKFCLETYFNTSKVLSCGIGRFAVT